MRHRSYSVWLPIFVTLQHSKSIEFFERALQRVNNSNPSSPEDKKALQETLDVNSWNCSCESLQVQDFQRGWSLFDWGLRTPADGAQKWQRALIKPFSSNDLPIWRGQNGDGKSLLLLEEQAIGDVMQFLTLFHSSQRIPNYFDFDYIACKLYTSDHLKRFMKASSLSTLKWM